MRAVLYQLALAVLTRSNKYSGNASGWNLTLGALV